jgi:hypothetical protein
VLVVRHNWGEDRVSYLAPDGGVRSLPISWTDLAPIDAVVTLAAGRALFRLEDLLTLRALVRGASACTPEAPSDKQITPLLSTK